MGRPKVIQTLETILARTDEVGECLEWQGIMHNGTPQIRIDRKLLSVRRAIRERKGNPAGPTVFLAPSCGNQKCVRPEHIMARTKTQHMLAMGKLIQHTPEFAVDYGSNGVRDFYRGIAHDAIAACQPAPAVVRLPADDTEGGAA